VVTGVGARVTTRYAGSDAGLCVDHPTSTQPSASRHHAAIELGNAVRVGVREKITLGQSSSSPYFPVVEYRNDRAERILCETDTGSSSLADKIPGRHVTLLVQTGKPLEGRILGITGLVFGLIFIVIGVVLGSIALTQYRISAWTFAAGVAILAALAFMGLRKLAGRDQFETDRSFSDRKYQERMEEKQALPLLGADELGPRLQRMNARARKLAPVMGARSPRPDGHGALAGQRPVWTPGLGRSIHAATVCA